MTGIKDLSIDSLAALVRKHGLKSVAERVGRRHRILGKDLNRAGYRWDGTRKPPAKAAPKLEKPKPYTYTDWPPAVAGKGEQTRAQMYAARQAQLAAEDAANRARRVAA